MIITFADTKRCECYKNFLEEPENRSYQKKFCKFYPIEIKSQAVRVHNRLKEVNNIGEYNALYKSNNCFEKVVGQSKNENLAIKVRINDAYRKFVNPMLITKNEDNLDTDEFILVKNCDNQFNQINKIHVFDINKHDYSILRK
ncbi:MAG: hypothetical protein LBP67_00170 [Bacteroidales bacterium]|jgi:hypothetical protein|nr:hypothetical protein [Bacteroidales bacterium]